jgi:tetratricopeptide (TPR) repeat protein
MSLSNYASLLSELGRSDEAEAKAKQALEIYEKLARAKPERFEPEWAMSLSNYASLLSELGRGDEAEAKAKQALEIYEKLARVRPARFEYDFISSRMFAAQCGWLAGKLPLTTEYPIAVHSTRRQQRTLDYWRGFFAAFAADELPRIREGIGKAEACWVAMDDSQKRSMEDCRLLLAGLAESRQIASTLTCKWREDLARFRTQRKGRLPSWMQEVARRAGFSL